MEYSSFCKTIRPNVKWFPHVDLIAINFGNLSYQANEYTPVIFENQTKNRLYRLFYKIFMKSL